MKINEFLSFDCIVESLQVIEIHMQVMVDNRYPESTLECFLSS
jgi:hypothetical protein